MGNRYPESRFFVYSDPNFARTLGILEEYAYLSRRIHELRNPVPSLETAGGGIQGPIAPTVFRGFYPVPAPVRPVSSGSNIDFTWQGSGFYRNFGGLQDGSEGFGSFFEKYFYMGVEGEITAGIYFSNNTFTAGWYNHILRDFNVSNKNSNSYNGMGNFAEKMKILDIGFSPNPVTAFNIKDTRIHMLVRETMF